MEPVGHGPDIRNLRGKNAAFASLSLLPVPGCTHSVAASASIPLLTLELSPWIQSPLGTEDSHHPGIPPSPQWQTRIAEASSLMEWTTSMFSVFSACRWPLLAYPACVMKVNPANLHCNRYSLYWFCFSRKTSLKKGSFSRKEREGLGGRERENWWTDSYSETLSVSRRELRERH